VGYQALAGNIGNDNTALGFDSLFSNTTGTYNTASGSLALYSNNGFNNTASGFGALGLNTTGSSNTADGLFALLRNTTGNNNIAIGTSSGTNLTIGSGNIDIGNAGVAAESNTIRIGTSQSRAFVVGVRNAVVTGGVAVYAAANGQLGTNPSSERFKHEISAMDKRSEAILALRPVSFRYQKELDPKQVAQFGLVAEEVAKVDPDLVVRDEKGALYSVRYEAVNAMLLNEFLKEHQTVQDLKKQVAELAAGLQKVSAQVELSKATPQIVNNN
jgi:Chaperone of endosialidase